MKKSIVLLLFLTMSMSCVAKPTCSNLIGDWTNELGSTLNIQSVGAGGEILGTYTSPSGTGGTPVALTGWANSLLPIPGQDHVGVVSFSVSWGAYGSVTSWSGGCSVKNAVPTIRTIWNLVRSNSSFDWDHILTGSDTFTPK